MLDRNTFLEVVRSAFVFLERDWGFELKGVEGELPEFWVTYSSADDCRVVVSLEAGSRPWVEVSFPASGTGPSGHRTNASLASLVRAEANHLTPPVVAGSIAGVDGGLGEVEAIQEDAELLRGCGHAALSGDLSARARIAAESARAWNEAQT